MQSRGYLSQCTDMEALNTICNKNPISGYIGFDCTASSLHVGITANNDLKANAETRA